MFLPGTTWKLPWQSFKGFYKGKVKNMNRYFYDLPVESFTSICRTCLMYAETEKFSIMEFSWETQKLKDIVYFCASLEVDDNDEMPKYMCSVCIRKIYDFYNFLTACKKSDSILKQILSNNITADIGIENDVSRILIENNETDNVIEIDVSRIVTEKNAADNVIEIDVNRILSEKNTTGNVIEIDVNRILSENNATDTVIENDVPVEHNIILDFKESDGEGNEDISYLPCNENRDPEDPQEIKTEFDESKTEETPKELISISTSNDLREEIEPLKIKSGSNIGGLQSYVIKLKPNIKSKTPPFICVTCHASFQAYEDLRTHKLETKHITRKYVCPYCHKRNSGYRYLEHLRTHTGEKPNICTSCGKGFNGKTDLRRHMAVHSDVKPYNCRFCNKGFTQKQYLVNHERKHTGEQDLCSFCGKVFISPSCRLAHEKKHIENDKPMKKDKMKCPLCDKVLISEQTLRNHILLIHGPKSVGDIFCCETCGKTCVTKIQLQCHVRSTHPVAKFPCTLCDREYKQKSGLDMHMLTHTGQTVICDICNKQLVNKKSLHLHRRLHTGDTKYQCKECLRIFTTRRNLESHMRTHTGEKPYICEYCSKAFALRTNLNQHVKIHKGEKRHQCTVCGKCFYNPRSVKKHMSVHEKTK